MVVGIQEGKFMENFIKRRKTKEISIGSVKIGGNNPIAVQSMCNTDTRDVFSTVNQIKALEAAGCEIVRVAVADMKAAEAVSEIKKQINIPLVADIHFDYRLALKVMENGVDKLRINPGNIGSEDRIKAVVDMAKSKNIPIRIGVNSGSLEKDILQKYGSVTAQGLVESALRHIRILEKFDFYDIVVSIKASNVPFCIEAYNMLSKETDYPLHLGITESGTVWTGSIKSAVSLTGDPVEEVKTAREILKSMGLRKFGVDFISCPTCGRTEINLIDIAKKVESMLANVDKEIKVAVMGCAVNGPGEAKEADIGIAGGKGYGLIFKKGAILKKCRESELIDELMKEIELL